MLRLLTVIYSMSRTIYQVFLFFFLHVFFHTLDKITEKEKECVYERSCPYNTHGGL